MKLELPRDIPWLHDFSWLHDLSSSRNITWLQPEALYLLIPVGVLLLWWLTRVNALRRIPAPIMRAIVLALLVLAMAGPQRLSTSEGAAKPVLLDASMSITPEMRAWAADLIRNQLKLKSTDPAIIFAQQPIAQNVGAALDALTSPSGCEACMPGATDLASALAKLIALGEGQRAGGAGHRRMGEPGRFRPASRQSARCAHRALHLYAARRGGDS